MNKVAPTSGSPNVGTDRLVCPALIESSCYPLGCDPPYLAVGAGKSNNCSKEPIKASKSFIVPLKALIIPYSDSYTLHNGSQSLLSALNTREARTQLITGSYQLSSALLMMLLRA